MKKNLRIVSAAAAALLAVAPVAASAVSSVSADVVLTDKSANVGSVSVNLNNKNSATSTAAQTAAENAIKSQFANSIGADANVIKLSNVKFSVPANSTDKNTQTVTFQVQYTNNKTQNWANGDIRGSQTVTAFSNYKWGNATNENNNMPYVVDKNGNTVTFTATVNFTNVASASTDTSDKINAGSSTIADADVNTNVNINAVAATKNTKGAINGNITTTVNGQTYTALLTNTNGTNMTVRALNNGAVSATPVTDFSSTSQFGPGAYEGYFSNVVVNLGNANAGKTLTFTLPNNAIFNNSAATNGNHSLKVTVDSNGIAHLGAINVKFYAYDANNMEGINFFAVKTGNVVTSGSVELNAVNGKLNINSVLASIGQEYGAAQYNEDHPGVPESVSVVNDLEAQLKKQGITVDANGYFEAPQSFTVNYNVKSNVNGAEASLPVTVSVPNGKAVATDTSNEVTTTKTIMHIAARYGKDGKKLALSTLRAYDEVSVVSTPVTINGKSFYKLAGKDEYVKASNIDGTKKTLKKNSYIYKRSATTNKFSKTKNYKATKKLAGETVTVYGGKMYNGSWYRIGKNQYIRARNF